MPENSHPATPQTRQEPDDKPPHLFLLRLWPEEGTASEDREWCGKAQHMITGEVQNFDGWPALIETLSAMLETAQKRRFHSGRDQGSKISDQRS